MAAGRKDATILHSKLMVPLPGGVMLPRLRLETCVKRFFAAGDRGLLICSAPVGYGKTFLLASVCRSRKDTAWLAVEPSDNNPYRFLSCAAASLFPSGGCPRFLRLNEKAGDPRFTPFAVARLFRRYFEFLARPRVWVIDEAHFLTNTFIRSLLQELTERLPRNLLFVLISRSDLPLRVSSLRMGGRMLEIRQRDLRASPEEVHALLAKSGITVDDVTEKKIHRRTEGWFACLKLFVLAWTQLPEKARPDFMKRFRGTHRFVADFLFENFLIRLSPENLDLLVNMALPASFTVKLCRLLAGRGDYMRHLAPIVKAGLVYTMRIEGRKWSRFHHLLRDFLLLRIPPERRPDLHERAARYFSKEGFAVRANLHLRLAQKARDLLAGREADSRGIALLEPALSGQAVLISRREKELLQQLAFGLTNDEIGQKMFISTGTVKWHLNNIYAKMGVRNRLEAVRKASATGIFSF